MSEQSLRNIVSEFTVSDDELKKYQYDTIAKYVTNNKSDGGEHNSMMAILMTHGADYREQTIREFIANKLDLAIEKSRYDYDTDAEFDEIKSKHLAKYMAEIEKYVDTYVDYSSQVGAACNAIRYVNLDTGLSGSRHRIAEIARKLASFCNEIAEKPSNGMIRRLVNVIRLYSRKIMEIYDLHNNKVPTKLYKKYKFHMESNNKQYASEEIKDMPCYIPFIHTKNGELGVIRAEDKYDMQLKMFRISQDIMEDGDDLDSTIKLRVYISVSNSIFSLSQFTIADVILLGWSLHRRMYVLDDTCNTDLRVNAIVANSIESKSPSLSPSPSPSPSPREPTATKKPNKRKTVRKSTKKSKARTRK